MPWWMIDARDRLIDTDAKLAPLRLVFVLVLIALVGGLVALTGALPREWLIGLAAGCAAAVVLLLLRRQ